MPEVKQAFPHSVIDSISDNLVMYR